MAETGISLTERAYTALKERIQNCVYMPGDSLGEKPLCDELECGRTPVREALLRLSGEGLIEIYPRRGLRVAPFTRTGISEIYQIRKLMEPAVCGKYFLRFRKSDLLDFDRRFEQVDRTDDRAYYSLDTAFHQFLIDAAGNRTLSTFFTGLMAVQYRFGVYSARLGTAVKHDYYTEHHEILEALLAEDGARIERALVAHTNYSEIIALKTLETAGVE